MSAQNSSEPNAKQEKPKSIQFAFKYATLVETAGLLDAMDDNEATGLKAFIELLITLKEEAKDPETVSKVLQLLSGIVEMVVTDESLIEPLARHLAKFTAENMVPIMAKLAGETKEPYAGLINQVGNLLSRVLTDLASGQEKGEKQ